MFDVKDLQVPYTIIAACQHLLKGETMGTIFGTVMDDVGKDRRVSIHVVLVPDWGSDLFSVTATMQEGVVTLFNPANLQIGVGGRGYHNANLWGGRHGRKTHVLIEVNLGCDAGGKMVLGRAPDGLA